MKKITHFILLILLSKFTFAQGLSLYERKENRMVNAYFPLYNEEAISVKNGSVGMDTCVIYKLPSSMSHLGHGGHFELYSAVSDRETGELLFYSDGGDQLINRNHEVMLNGDSIFSCNSAEMGLAIVPFPNDKNKYYVFTTLSFYGHDFGDKNNLIYYSVVDMSLDNGLGGVVANQKNIILDTNPHESLNGDQTRSKENLYVIPGNNCDYWLVRGAGLIMDINAMTAYSHNIKYHITESGINATALLSDTMESLNFGGTKYMRKHPKMNLFVENSREYLRFFQMDYETGKYKYLKGGLTVNILQGETSTVYFLDFSKDGKYLYFTRSNEGNRSIVHRMEITGVNDTEVLHSVPDSVVLDGADFRYMKLINDTIFLVESTRGGLFYINDDNGSFSIEDHNTPILYHEKLITMDEMAVTSDVLFPTSIIRTNRNAVAVCAADKIDIVSSGDKKQYDYWAWNTGDTGAILNVDFIPGDQYWLTYSRFNGTCREIYVDTFTLKDSIIDAQPLIQVRENYLLVEDIYDSYQWLLDGNDIPGATSFEHKVEKNGVYQIRTTLGISSSNSCEYLSEPYRVNNATSLENHEAFKLKIYPSIIENGIVNIDGNITGLSYKIYDVVGKELQQGIAEHQVQLSFSAQGIYYIELYNGESSVLKERFFLK